MISNSRIILVVENDLLVCQYVAELLEDNGFIAFTATSVEEAIQILNVSDNLDLLITDIDLGGILNGFDLAKSSRKMFPNLPVIFVTGSTSVNKGAENTRFLIKPYDDERLISNINEVLTASA